MKKRGFKVTGCVPSLIALSIVGFLLVGYIMCIVKVCKCNWEPIGKAEAMYTAGALTGAGCVIGWIDIQDK